MKKPIALLLVVCLVMSTPLMALAARPNTPGPPAQVVTPLYLNLGDSIAYGLSAEPGKSYFDQYADFLKKGPSMNLGVPGATTGELLAALGTPEFQRAVARADIITISIGGNNLLRPVILAAFGAYGLNYEDYGNMEEALTALYTAIYQEEMILSGTWQAKVDSILASPELSGFLTAGATGFAGDWGSIIASIRSLNENAAIMVLNLYNPVKAEDNPVLHGVFDGFLDLMNMTLNELDGFYDYQVIDVYNAFKMNPSAVAFSLAWDTLNLDPHPTTAGHSTIFSLLTALGNVRAFQPGKPVFAGNPGSPAMAEAEVIAVVDADAGLPAAHEDGEGNPLSVFGFGQAVNGLVREDPGALVEHVRAR